MHQFLMCKLSLKVSPRLFFPIRETCEGWQPSSRVTGKRPTPLKTPLRASPKSQYVNRGQAGFGSLKASISKTALTSHVIRKLQPIMSSGSYNPRNFFSQQNLDLISCKEQLTGGESSRTCQHSNFIGGITGPGEIVSRECHILVSLQTYHLTIFCNI